MIVKLGKIVVCQCLGTKRQKILYRDIEEIKRIFWCAKTILHYNSWRIAFC